MKIIFNLLTNTIQNQKFIRERHIKASSKDRNLVPFLVFDVFVNGEDEHEHEEEASAAEEVPDVVSDIKSGRLSAERMGFQKPTHPS